MATPDTRRDRVVKVREKKGERVDGRAPLTDDSGEKAVERPSSTDTLRSDGTRNRRAHHRGGNGFTIANRHQSIRHTFMTNPGKNACAFFGWTLLGLGFLGFVSPGLFGGHFTPIHNLIYFGSGLIALFASRVSSAGMAGKIAITLGVVYGLVGIAGFFAGAPGYPSVPDHGMTWFLWAVVPAALEFGTSDHLIHLALGVLMILGTVLPQRRLQVEP